MPGWPGDRVAAGLSVIKDLLAGSGLWVQTLAPLDLPHVGPHRVPRWLPRS